MKTEHTPEPWVAITGGRLDPEVIITTQCRLGESLGEICGMDIEFTGQHGIEQKANARRIVACVNACAGIPDEQLYDQDPGCLLSAMVDQEQEIMTITKQRDELLDLVKYFINELPMTSSQYEWCRQAIASVKENGK